LSLRLNFDEDVHGSLSTLLSADGFDVLTTQRAGRAAQSLPDYDQIAFAATEGRAIFTHNVTDYLLLAHEWAAAGREHAGMILSHQHPVRELRRRFLLFITRYPDGMANICDWL
jgi:hypothetical protein